jgi:hypothetical protein
MRARLAFILCCASFELLACGGDDPAPGGTGNELRDPAGSAEDGGRAPRAGSDPNDGNDQTLPSVTIERPSDGDVVGGRVRVEVTIEDEESGLARDSLSLRAGDAVAPLRAVDDKSKRFTGELDVRGLGAGVRETNINVIAEDRAGNRTIQSVSVKLDNVAPMVSLDPPPVRVARRGRSDGALVCSALFDPLGSDAIDDGMITGTATEFRARIEDMTNGAVASQGTIGFLAGVDDEQVQLFLSNRLEEKLLVDTNGDGVCDDVNPRLVPSADNARGAATVVQLHPTKPDGEAYYDPASDVTLAPSPAHQLAGGSVFERCTNGKDRVVPKPVCVSTVLPEIIHASGQSDRMASIYGKGPIDGANTCAGDAFDFQSSLHTPGWACVAVRVADKAGNVAVSAPLRVCFDDGTGTCGGPFGSLAPEAARPSCSASCTPAPSFESQPQRQLVVHTR